MSLNAKQDGLIALAAVLLLLFYVIGAGGGFPLDDSWIHQTYGRNLALYGEWAFTPGIPSTASTSPLYTLILAAGHALRIPVPLWTHGMGLISLILMGWVGARMAQRLVPEQRNIGLYTGLGLVSAWHLLWAAAAGMETHLFSLLVMLLIWHVWRELDAPGRSTLASFLLRGALFGLLGGLATLARPEGALMVLILAAALSISRPHMSLRAWLAYGSAAALVYLLVLAPYLAFNLSVTGGLLPNTAASKRADLRLLFERPYFQRIIDLVIPLTAGAQILLVPGVVWFARHLIGQKDWQRMLLLITPLVWSLSLIALYAAYLPAFFQHGRYVIPGLPTFIICGMAGTAQLVRWGQRRMLQRAFTRALALAVGLMYAVMALSIGFQTYREDVSIIDSEMVRSAEWIRQNIPPESLMAIHDIGAVGFFAPRAIVDLAGLVSPELLPLIPVELNGAAVWAELERRGVEYVMGFADQLPGGDPDDPRLCPVFRARGMDEEVSITYNMSIYRVNWQQNCP